jgi:hypothetical protein
MALSSTTDILRVLGMTDAEAYQLGRFSGQSELNAEIRDAQDTAVAYFVTRAPTYYTGSATSETNVDMLFRKAEATIAAYYFGHALWARKAMGTHWAVDQEDSDSFRDYLDGLIDRAQSLVNPYLVIDEEESPFALPSIALIGPIAETEYQDVATDLEEMLARAEPGAVRLGI